MFVLYIHICAFVYFRLISLRGIAYVYLKKLKIVYIFNLKFIIAYISFQKLKICIYIKLKLLIVYIYISFLNF